MSGLGLLSITDTVRTRAPKAVACLSFIIDPLGLKKLTAPVLDFPYRRSARNDLARQTTAALFR